MNVEGLTRENVASHLQVCYFYHISYYNVRVFLVISIPLWIDVFEEVLWASLGLLALHNLYVHDLHLTRLSVWAMVVILCGSVQGLWVSDYNLDLI